MFNGLPDGLELEVKAKQARMLAQAEKEGLVKLAREVKSQNLKTNRITGYRRWVGLKLIWLGQKLGENSR